VSEDVIGIEDEVTSAKDDGLTTEAESAPISDKDEIALLSDEDVIALVSVVDGIELTNNEMEPVIDELGIVLMLDEATGTDNAKLKRGNGILPVVEHSWSPSSTHS
jgi:hypothetical protein